MIREDKFVLSKNQYAINLSDALVITDRIMAYERSEPVSVHTHWLFPAVWYRRANRVTKACLGTLRKNYWGDAPEDLNEALLDMTDGRYGGDCRTRWDGISVWSHEPYETVERHLAVLRPMLENYPEVPAGYTGWYRFPQ